MDDFDVKKYRAMTDDFLRLNDEVKGLNLLKKEALDKDEDYKKLLEEKKVLLNEIKAYEENKVPEIISDINNCKTNIALIKEDFKEGLQIKAGVVNDILKYRKILDQTTKDQLKEVSDNYVTIYECE